jgi:hypothetical protein
LPEGTNTSLDISALSWTIRYASGGTGAVATSFQVLILQIIFRDRIEDCEGLPDIFPGDVIFPAGVDARQALGIAEECVSMARGVVKGLRRRTRSCR